MKYKNFEEALEHLANYHSLRTKVEKVVEAVYWHLVGHGYKPTIVNDRYIAHEGKDYQLRRNRKINGWEVKELG